ncbi:MAG: hypothetical protein GF383_13945 [Candidatus Lokiarchaeota archaeon]|nr:hypothetical protein [Candidatus Lokiarchaeota archaeon]MBD3342421.1 hypothetical protein [Candidatus Lokiarchaeota archaeon]
MVIRESGLLFRGYNLVHAKYHQTSDNGIDPDLRSGLLTALLNFAESAFSMNKVEYFEMKKFVISFIQDSILAHDSPEEEILIVYAIMDKERKIDKHISKVIVPSLKKVAQAFKRKYNGQNLSEISKFLEFKSTLAAIFGSDTKTVDQKLKGTFF